ncbi:hypothetical protein GCM10009557_30480 [Virgisporangium ochraceum]
MRRRVDDDSAADLVAEIFAVAWRRIHDVPRADARLWLFGVGRNVVANHLRGSGRAYRLIEKVAANTVTQADDHAAAMAVYLTENHPPGNGPAEILAAIADLVRDLVLGPARRAALLRVLAEVPGLIYRGGTTDRAGRRGEAFMPPNRHGGLASERTLIVDPVTGRLLDTEILLLEKGRLDVRTPCVYQYEIHTVSEFADP